MPRILNPYEGAPDRWLRGNLHAHTTESDGACSPAEVIADYASKGYDFLAISDHDRVVNLEPYRDSAPLALIQAQEAGAGPHVLCVDLAETLPPPKDRQELLRLVCERGGFTILNHPNWGESFRHWPQETLETLTGFAGIEIYNAVIDWLEGSSLATDRWDMLLSRGHRVWGFANDDSHRPEGVGRAWNMVAADDRTPDSICAAMVAGRFYASTGVSIRSITLDGRDLRVVTADSQRVRFVTLHGIVRAFDDGPDSTYHIEGDEGYVRAECYGPGDTMAWTQPLFVEPD